MVHKKRSKGSRSASALLELEAESSEALPYKRNSGAVFRSAFASHQPLARLVGERGGGAALFAKKCDLINDNISAESLRSKNIKTTESLKDSSDSVEYSDKIDSSIGKA